MDIQLVVADQNVDLLRLGEGVGGDPAQLRGVHEDGPPLRPLKEGPLEAVILGVFGGEAEILVEAGAADDRQVKVDVPDALQGVGAENGQAGRVQPPSQQVHLRFFQPFQLQGAGEAAGVDQIVLLGNEAAEFRGGGAGADEHAGVGPQQGEGLLGDLLLALLAEGVAEKVVILHAHGGFDGAGAAVDPDDPLGVVHVFQVPAEGHLGDAGEMLLQRGNGDGALQIDDPLNIVVSLGCFHDGFPLLTYRFANSL